MNTLNILLIFCSGYIEGASIYCKKIEYIFRKLYLVYLAIKIRFLFQCFDHDTVTNLKGSIQNEGFNHTTFSEMCPMLMYSLLSDCSPTDKTNVFDIDVISNSATGLTWIYSVLAVFVISICGVGALIIIPVMQKRFYKPLMQFLVALAVGKYIVLIKFLY